MPYKDKNKEIIKCVIICSNCHRKEHEDLRLKEILQYV